MVSSMPRSFITCPNWGMSHVPYPLSTDDSCGHPDYRIFCNNNQLEFRSLDGIFYPIISIKNWFYRLVIRLPAVASDSCTTMDYSVEGFYLDENLPFNISKRNTVMLLNCLERLLLSPLNCTSISLCHRFEDEMEEVMACKGKLCYTYLKGTSYTSHRIRVHEGGWSAYTSVVNINSQLPTREWNYGIEIQWIPV
ncbi:hypothetical protein SUGI_0110730 [Cryptomeria japonica]|nr:hypothetical protein SUGI_0110730 [Cryptomeria japonica]